MRRKRNKKKEKKNQQQQKQRNLPGINLNDIWLIRHEISFQMVTFFSVPNVIQFLLLNSSFLFCGAVILNELEVCRTERQRSARF